MTMSDKKDDHYHDALLEHIDDQLKGIAEGQAAMASVPGDINEIKDRLTSVESRLTTIEAAVTDQGHQVRDHEVRITHLEQAA